jgi:hypothetical protein
MTAPAELGADAALELRIADKVDELRIVREARRRLENEGRTPAQPPDVATLRDRLQRPHVAVEWLIAGWFARRFRAMVAAQFKAGKTTLVTNLVRCLVDGDDWLGQFQVSAVAGTVAVLDFEMSSTQLTEWYRAQRIRNDHRVLLISLRGQGAAFNLLDRAVMLEWASFLKAHGVDVLVLDCLRPLLDALGLDEHKDVGRLLTSFDEFLQAADIDSAFVIQHMGHGAERARGDSRLRDWPDVELKVIRQDDAPGSPRFISAYGRDVDQPEMQLAFDGLTRRLSVAGGTRQDARSKAALDAIIDVLAGAATALSGRAIKAALAESDYPRDVVDAALRSGLSLRRLKAESGPRNSRLYSPVSEYPTVSGECPSDSPSECPAAYIKPDTRTLTQPSLPSGVRPDTRRRPFSIPTAEATA